MIWLALATALPVTVIGVYAIRKAPPEDIEKIVQHLARWGRRPPADDLTGRSRRGLDDGHDGDGKSPAGLGPT